MERASRQICPSPTWFRGYTLSYRRKGLPGAWVRVVFSSSGLSRGGVPLGGIAS